MGTEQNRIEVIVRGVLLRDSQVLVCKNLKHGHLYLPGGHVEFGESAQVALVREFAEETGLRVRVGGLIAVGDHAFAQRGTRKHELNLVFHVEHPSRHRFEARSLEDGIDFEWINASRLSRSKMVPHRLSSRLSTLLRTQSSAGTWLSEF